MSRFTSTARINSRWRNNDFVGAAGSTHTFPDAFHEEFLVDWALQISDGSIVITETPTTGVIQMAALTVGDIVLTGTATGNFGGGGGGVATVSGTAPITTSGTTAITVAINQGSTTAVGALQLIDSPNSTSITTAATPNAVKTAYDIATAGWEAFTFGTSGIIGTHPRFVLTTSNTPASGVVHHNKIVPHKDFTVSNIAFVSGNRAAATVTLIRFGIYTRSGTTFTLVARTASDTTIFNATNTKFTRALDTTGGYPATYTMTAGTEYWISVIQVATTTAILVNATARLITSANAATGGQVYTQSSQSDLPASSTGTISGGLGGDYAGVS